MYDMYVFICTTHDHVMVKVEINLLTCLLNTPVQSVLKNKNQSLSRFVVQTLLATIVLLDDYSLGVRSFKEKRLPCFQYEQKTLLNAIF